MSGIRNHRLYFVTCTRLERDRIEDALGELVGYAPAHRGHPNVIKVIAPSEDVARAWVAGRWAHDDVQITDVYEEKIDAFIQEHMY